MKKTLKLAAIFILILAFASVSLPVYAGVDGSEVVTAPYTLTAPEIDGIFEPAIWNNAAKITPSYHSSADPQTSADVYLLCDSEFIYVFASVTDSVIDTSGEKTYQKDSVNLVIDYNYNRDPSFQYGDSDPVISMNFSAINTGGGDYIWKAVMTDKGFDFEGKMPILTEYTPGGKVGFEVIINDAQNGDRADMLMWDENGGDSWAYTNVLGTLIYGEKPAETAAPAAATETAAPAAADTPAEATPAITSPQTSDMLLAAVPVISAALWLLFKKK